MPEEQSTEQQKRDILLERIKSLATETGDPTKVISALRGDITEVERALQSIYSLFGGTNQKAKQLLDQSQSFQNVIKDSVEYLGSLRSSLALITGVQAQLSALQKQYNLSTTDSIKLVENHIQSIRNLKQELKSVQDDASKLLHILKQWGAQVGIELKGSDLEKSKKLLDEWLGQHTKLQLDFSLSEIKSLDDLKEKLNNWIKNNKFKVDITADTNYEHVLEILQLQKKTALLEEYKRRLQDIQKVEQASSPYTFSTHVKEKIGGIAERSAKALGVESFVEAYKGNLRYDASSTERILGFVGAKIRYTKQQREQERTQEELEKINRDFEMTVAGVPKREPTFAEKASGFLFGIGHRNAIKAVTEGTKTSGPEVAAGFKGTLPSLFPFLGRDKYSIAADVLGLSLAGLPEEETISSSKRKAKVASPEEFVPFKNVVAESYKTASQVVAEMSGTSQQKILVQQANALDDLNKQSKKQVSISRDTLDVQEESMTTLTKLPEEMVQKQVEQQEMRKPISGSFLGSLGLGAASLIHIAGKSAYGTLGTGIGIANDWLSTGLTGALKTVGSGISTLTGIALGESAGKVTGTMVDAVINAIVFGIGIAQQKALAARAFASEKGYAASPTQGGWGSAANIEALYSSMYITREDALRLSQELAKTGLDATTQLAQGSPLLFQYANLYKELGEYGTEAFKGILTGLGDATNSFRTVLYVTENLGGKLKGTLVTTSSLLQTISSLAPQMRMFNIDTTIVTSSLVKLVEKSSQLGALGINIGDVQTQQRIMKDWFDRSQYSLSMLAYLGTKGGKAGVTPTQGIVQELLGAEVAKSYTINLEGGAQPVLSIGKLSEKGAGGIFQGLESITAQRDVLVKLDTLKEAMKGKSKDEALVAAIIAGQQMFGMSKEGVLALLSVSEEELKNEEVVKTLQGKTLPVQEQISRNIARVAGLTEYNQKIQLAAFNLIVLIASVMVGLPFIIYRAIKSAVPGWGAASDKAVLTQFQTQLTTGFATSMTEIGNTMKVALQKSGQGSETVSKMVGATADLISGKVTHHHSGAKGVSLSSGIVTDISEYILPSLGTNEAFMIGHGSIDVLTPSQMNEAAKGSLDTLIHSSKKEISPIVNVETKPQIVINIKADTMDKDLIFEAIRSKLSQELR